MDYSQGKQTERRPGNATLLGFFGRANYGSLQNVDLSANLFPQNAFRSVLFDPELVYGYEDMDLCYGLLCHGYRIVFVPEMQNEHLPPAKSASEIEKRDDLAEWARGYALFKRWWFWNKRPVVGYLVLALYCFHRAAALLKRHRYTAAASLPVVVAEIASRVRANAARRTPTHRRVPKRRAK